MVGGLLSQLNFKKVDFCRDKVDFCRNKGDFCRGTFVEMPFIDIIYRNFFEKISEDKILY